MDFWGTKQEWIIQSKHTRLLITLLKLSDLVVGLFDNRACIDTRWNWTRKHLSWRLVFENNCADLLKNNWFSPPHKSPFQETLLWTLQLHCHNTKSLFCIVHIQLHLYFIYIYILQSVWLSLSGFNYRGRRKQQS